MDKNLSMKSCIISYLLCRLFMLPQERFDQFHLSWENFCKPVVWIQFISELFASQYLVLNLTILKPPCIQRLVILLLSAVMSSMDHFFPPLCCTHIYWTSQTKVIHPYSYNIMDKLVRDVFLLVSFRWSQILPLGTHVQLVANLHAEPSLLLIWTKFFRLTFVSTRPIISIL